MRKLCITVVAGLILSLGSCKKQPTNYEDLSDNKEMAVLTLQKGINGRQDLKIFPQEGSRTTQISVNYGGVGLPASAINIQLEVDNAAIDSINTARIARGEEAYEQFPADSYVLDKTSLTIASGKVISDAATLTYNTEKFDLAKQYIIVFKSSNTAGYKYYNGVNKVEFLAAVIEKEQSKTGWIASASSEHPGEATGLASALIDNNIGTFWHSNYGGVAATYPHEAQVLFNSEVFVTKISLHKRQAANTTWFKVFDLYGTTDGTTWKLLGENLETVADELDAQYYPIDPQYLKGIKLLMKSGHNTSSTTHLAEISVFGY